MTTLQATPFEPILSSFLYTSFSRDKSKPIVWLQGLIVDDGTPLLDEFSGHMGRGRGPRKGQKREMMQRGPNFDSAIVNRAVAHSERTSVRTLPIWTANLPVTRLVRGFAQNGATTSFTYSGISQIDVAAYGITGLRYQTMRIISIKCYNSVLDSTKVPTQETIISYYEPGTSATTSTGYTYDIAAAIGKVNCLKIKPSLDMLSAQIPTGSTTVVLSVNVPVDCLVYCDFTCIFS
jgi:hypothetical protein